MNLRTLTLVGAVAAFTLALAVGDKTIIETRLTGSGKGKAKFQLSASNGGQAELEVEGENLRRNTAYSVNVANGAVQARVTTDAFGEFNLERRYGARSIPPIKAGDRVVVRNSQNVVVLSGVLAPRR